MLDGPEGKSPEDSAGSAGPPLEDGWIEVTPARRPPRSREELLAMMPPRRGFPFGWALLLVPALVAGGWAIGRMPEKARPHPAKPDARAAAVESAAPETPASTGPMEMPPRVIDQPDPAAAGKLGRPSRWTTSIADAEAESRRTGKPILVDFNADWCGPCRAMRAQVFDDATLGDAVRRLVVPVSIVDRSRENGANTPEVEELMQSYSIDAFPTLVVYKPGGGRTLRTTGFGDADQTLDWIRNAANAAR
jgi:thiol:disulfide interchange protein